MLGNNDGRGLEQCEVGGAGWGLLIYRVRDGPEVPTDASSLGSAQPDRPPYAKGDLLSAFPSLPSHAFSPQPIFPLFATGSRPNIWMDVESPQHNVVVRHPFLLV